MQTLEEITYEAGRHALAVQEALVEGIRQRTGTLLAAHALVASFVGGTTLRDGGVDAWVFVALAALLVGLVVAAALLAPWRLTFAIDARQLHSRLYDRAVEDAEAGTSSWLVAAGFSYQALADRNRSQVGRMSRLSVVLAALVVVQTVAWFAGFALD